MTSEERKKTPWIGPYELLDLIKEFIDDIIIIDEQKNLIPIREQPNSLPLATAVGYYILSTVIDHMGGLQ